MGKFLTFLGASLCLAWTATAMAQTPPDAFKDVDRSHWAYDAVESLRQKGILVGYPDGYFRGKRTLTRYEFAVALDRALKNVTATPGPQGEKGEKGEPGEKGERGEVGPPGVTPEEIATMRRLAEEFKNELASLGNNINAINAKLDKLARDVADIQSQLAKMPKWSGQAFWGVRSDSGNPRAIDQDGRQRAFNQAVVHNLRLGLDANIPGGATVSAGLVVDNYVPYLGGSTAIVSQFGGTTTASRTFAAPEDVRLDLLEVRAPFAALGRGSSLTVGRFAQRLGRLTLWKPDVDSYFTVPWVNDGYYRMDGARLDANLGSLGLEVFGAQTSSVNGTNLGAWNSPLAGAANVWRFGSVALPGAPYPTSTVPSGKPIAQPFQNQAVVTQLMGVSASLGIRQLEGGHIRFTALEANTPGGGTGVDRFGNPVAAIRPFNNVAVLGTDFDLKIADRITISGDAGRSIPIAPGHRIKPAGGLDKDNNAFNANVGYQSGGLGITAGYRYIDPMFYAPGYWGKIGNWFNPTNVQGPTFRAGYDITGTIGVKVGGDFFTAAHNRDGDGGLGRDDEINRLLVGLRWDISKNFQTTVDWEGVFWKLVGTHAGALPGNNVGGGAPGTVHPTEHYITIGTGYNLTASTILKLMYQIGSFDGHGSLFDGPNTRQNFNVFATQVAVKF